MAVVMLALTGGVLCDGCGGGGAGAQRLTPVARAAYVTSRGPGYKFTLDISASLNGHSFDFGGEGTLDEQDMQGAFSMKVNGTTVQELTKYPYIYMRLPAGAGSALAENKPWARANIDVYTQALGASSPVGGNADGPTQMLDLLKSSASISKLGSQDIRGVKTTHYHALIDLDRYAAALKGSQRIDAQHSAQLLKRMTGANSLPIDVWIDSRQRVRRTSMHVRLCTKEGELSETMTMNLYDYARQPLVAVPPAAQTTDITSKLKSEISQSLQQLGC
jgi:hypothetical protein